MKIHKCYFCNYETQYKNNFRNHVCKRNKCNFLIYSIPINSLEDYYKLVDLHIKDPENHMWGENPNSSPEKYYNSDDDDSEKEENNNITVCFIGAACRYD